MSMLAKGLHGINTRMLLLLLSWVSIPSRSPLALQLNHSFRRHHRPK
ncbi:hypothetical protein GLYMA_02G186350v4 [Glycine max]|nr:hypothetical protein GLYMA_02G186350v4 [Glycine max]KAH1061002.1 hypothetical protein GYH30_004473 [Glycine max]